MLGCYTFFLSKVGAPFSLRERESASLGAMGAAQWLGQWRTRPHALLDLQPFKEAAAKAQNASSTITTTTTQEAEAETEPLNDNDAVQSRTASAAKTNAKTAAKASKKKAAAPTDPFEAWKKSLPRGAKRTLAKADLQDFSVQARPIRGNQPAPHSSLAHFRCS